MAPKWFTDDEPEPDTGPVSIRQRLSDDLPQLVAIAKAVHRSDGYPPYMPDDDFLRFVASDEGLAAWVATRIDGSWATLPSTVAHLPKFSSLPPLNWEYSAPNVEYWPDSWWPVACDGQGLGDGFSIMRQLITAVEDSFRSLTSWSTSNQRSRSTKAQDGAVVERSPSVFQMEPRCESTSTPHPRPGTMHSGADRALGIPAGRRHNDL